MNNFNCNKMKMNRIVCFDSIPHHQMQIGKEEIHSASFEEQQLLQLQNVATSEIQFIDPSFLLNLENTGSYPLRLAEEIIEKQNSKVKRRSKNIMEGRSYKCKHCSKTYLSYPALYTHTKTKHKEINDHCLSNGRSRGRPKVV